MKRLPDRALSAMKRSLARYDVPALITDDAWHIRYRNEKAARLFYRQRCIDALFPEEVGKGSSLTVRLLHGKNTLFWLSPLQDGMRRVLVLRILGEEESRTAEKILLSRPDKTGAEAADPEPLELISFLTESGLLSPSAEEEPVWTVPEVKEVLLQLIRLLRFSAGEKTVPLELKKTAEQVSLTFSFSTENHQTILTRLFTEVAGEDLERILLLSVLSRRSGFEYDAHISEDGKTVTFTIRLPLETRFPAHFFQGRKTPSGRRNGSTV